MLLSSSILNYETKLASVLESDWRPAGCETATLRLMRAFRMATTGRTLTVARQEK